MIVDPKGLSYFVAAMVSVLCFDLKFVTRGSVKGNDGTKRYENVFPLHAMLLVRFSTLLDSKSPA